MKKPKILVVGSLVMDLIVSTERVPNAGETVFGHSFRTAPGGKGANQAVQAARLGADVTMVGMVGDDAFGRELTASLAASGIDTRYIFTAPEGVSSAIGSITLTTQNGVTLNNRIIVVPGANMRITPQDVAFLKEDIGQYDCVILQLEITPAVNEAVAAYAHAKGVPVMLNSAPSAPLSDALLACLSYISPNEYEAADLTGVVLRDNTGVIHPEQVQQAAVALRKKGVQKAIITLGDSGAVVAGEGLYSLQPCVPNVKVADPTAAGDSFVGAFCTALYAGLSDEQAVQFANHTAALTVSKMGAQPSLPTLDEVLAAMQQRGFDGFSPSLLDALKGA